MLIQFKPGVSAEDFEGILAEIASTGRRPCPVEGQPRRAVVIEGELSGEPLKRIEAMAAVERVVPVAISYPLASRETQQADTVLTVGRVKIGGGHLALIAGPCAVESEALLSEAAAAVRAAGATLLRGGVFKPRTSPYSFQGLGLDGLKILRAVGDEFGMPVVTEVVDPRHVHLVARHAEVLQVGARNMQNFELLKEVGGAGAPVLLKRGPAATVDELLSSAEYVLSRGNGRVLLCERGLRTFDPGVRNLLDLSCVPRVKAASHLPILVDPSHGTGRPGLIPAMSLAAVAAGCDGLIIEVHPQPEQALSDGIQSLRPAQFADLARRVRQLADAMRLCLSQPEPDPDHEGPL